MAAETNPLDAVEEYCKYLAAALQTHDIQLEIHRVAWEKDGWLHALQALRLQATKWRDTLVLTQYTALAWSARGFPQRVLRAVKILKSCGARVGIVFHDVEAYPGTRLIDSVRSFGQVYTMRRAFICVDLNVFTVLPERLSWLTTAPPSVVFVPAGPNLPIPAMSQPSFREGPLPTIGVFSITGGKSGDCEMQIILTAVRHAAQGSKSRVCPQLSN